jgi:hypothetical protein
MRFMAHATFLAIAAAVLLRLSTSASMALVDPGAFEGAGFAFNPFF